MKELENTQQQKSCKILLVGDSCVDKFHYGVCERISPEAPVPIFKHMNTEVKNGMCLNVEQNLKAFKFAEISVLTNTEKITKERFVDINSGQHLLRTDFGENKKINHLPSSRITKDLILQYDYVIISDYNKGFITENLAEKILNICKPLSIPVFVDSKKTNLSCFNGAYIKINQKEYLQIDKKSVNMSMLIVTKGKHGCIWDGKVFPTDMVEVSDVSGAGDTFLSSLVYGIYKHKDITKAIKIANKCSSFVVQRSGTYALGEEDVEELCI